jgi:hypothetical protein
LLKVFLLINICNNANSIYGCPLGIGNVGGFNTIPAVFIFRIAQARLKHAVMLVGCMLQLLLKGNQLALVLFVQWNGGIRLKNIENLAERVQPLR